MADLLLDFAGRRLVGGLAGLNSAGEDGPAAGQLDLGIGDAEVEEEASMGVDEDDADAVGAGERKEMGEEAEEEHAFHRRL